MQSFRRVATEIYENMGGSVGHMAANERDAEWQRVNSLIADVLKDSGVLYSKLVRLQGDFAGGERSSLEEIANGVRAISDDLSGFSKSFYEGELEMRTSETPFDYSTGAPVAPPESGAPPSYDVDEEESEESEESSEESDFDVEAELIEEEPE